MPKVNARVVNMTIQNKTAQELSQFMYAQRGKTRQDFVARGLELIRKYGWKDKNESPLTTRSIL